jgi:hypothetical protein
VRVDASSPRDYTVLSRLALPWPRGGDAIVTCEEKILVAAALHTDQCALFISLPNLEILELNPNAKVEKGSKNATRLVLFDVEGATCVAMCESADDTVSVLSRIRLPLATKSLTFFEFQDVISQQSGRRFHCPRTESICPQAPGELKLSPDC